MNQSILKLKKSWVSLQNMGYSVERFEKADVIRDMMPELLCSICQGVFRKPLRINTCQHDFCRDCLTSWLDEGHNQSCPTCREDLPNNHHIDETCVVDRSITSMVERLKIFCVFSK